MDCDAPGARTIKSATGQPLAGVKPNGRSRITNGSALLPEIDGRSIWARRLRDLIDLHLSDLGGEENVSEAEKRIVRRAAALTMELERLEAKFLANGEAKPKQLELYGRTANTCRRLLECLGLQRRARDITPPDPLDYARQRETLKNSFHEGGS
jgi:hypothetical protein